MCTERFKILRSLACCSRLPWRHRDAENECDEMGVANGLSSCVVSSVKLDC